MSQIAGLESTVGAGPPEDIGSFLFPASAIAFKFTFSGTTYYTVIRTGMRGWVLVGGPSALPETAINAAFTALGAGARIVLQDATYTTGTTGIVFTAINQALEGQGRGTFINGDALLTGNHAISITAFSDCKVSNLSLQTQDGGAKICHGIFLENGADRALVENVTVVDCDSDAIHIEGTTTTGITIKNCHVLDADDYGIHVNADGGNNIQYMKIVENEIREAGLDGMYFEGGIYINFNQLIGNTIVGSTKSGINGGALYESIISNNMCIGNGEHGILIAAGWNDTIGNHCESNVLNGIYIHSAQNNCSGNNCILNLHNGIWNDTSENLIEGNHCDTNTRHGIFLSDGYRCNVTGNYCYGNDVGDTATYDGINMSNPAETPLIVGNYCRGNHRHGIGIMGNLAIVTGNYVLSNDRDGIWLYYNSHIVVGNRCTLNGLDAASTYDAIHAVSSPYCLISGNACSDGKNGIYIEDCSSCLITGNRCHDNTEIGVKLEFNCDNNFITDNFFIDNTLYGVYIKNANCDNNQVQRNFYSGNGTAPVYDVGTGTIFDSIQFQFQQGGAAGGITVAQFIFAAGSAKGWEIDAAAEWAIALGTLPLEVKQVVRIKIWAVGLADPGAANQMRADFAINAGQPHEVYTGEVIAVASKESDQTDFDVNDVITWTLTASDDADIGHLVGGDCLETRVDYRAAVAPDIETDAVFRCVEIQYV